MMLMIMMINNTKLMLDQVPCSYEVSAISKFALLMFMSEFCCYVLLNF